MALSKIQSESMNLADTFAFTGTVSGAGNMSLISSGSSASAVSDLQVDFSSNTDFAIQRLVINDCYQSSSQYFYLRFFESGSEVDASASYMWTVGSYGDALNPGKSQTNSANYLRLNHYSIGDSSSQPNVLDINFYNPAESGMRTHLISFRYGDRGGGGVNHLEYCGGARLANAVSEKFKIYPVSGTISYASYQLYGIKK
jgi:hypothetical protein